MLKIYYNRLLTGSITYDTIPEKYQEGVKELAKADVAKGKMPVSQYEQLFHEEYEE